ncbi:MAG TPA: tetratricopeptide repeat protein [Blastocatellia bacterium]|nr:tetratricopeptide repeat protein [Blastocatellia bacterium]
MLSMTSRARCLIAASLTLLISGYLLSGTNVEAQKDNRGVKIVKVRMNGGNEIDLYSESHALIVGVSRYEYGEIGPNKELRNLPGVAQDVDKVKLELERHGFSVKVLSNPTRKEFDDTMREFISTYGQVPQARLLFYFAGHGYTLSTDDERTLGYFLPADIPPPSKNGAFRQKAIGMGEMQEYANQIGSKHALFIFDSCFSGTLFETMRPLPVPPVITEKVLYPVRFFITAGTKDQEVPDRSIFREQFIEALQGAADRNRDGYVTGVELGEFLVEKVTNYSNRAQTPVYGKIRDPKLDKGDLVFVAPESVKPAVRAETTKEDDLLKEDIGKASSYYSQAWTFKQAGKTAEAEQAFRDASMYAPKNVEYRINLAWHLFAQEKYPEAADEFRKAIANEPNNTEAYRALGWTLDRAFDVVGAAEAFKRAVQLELKPKPRAEAHYGLGLMLERMGKKKEATLEFRNAVQLDPTEKKHKEALRRLQ